MAEIPDLADRLAAIEHVLALALSQTVSHDILQKMEAAARGAVQEREVVVLLPPEEWVRSTEELEHRLRLLVQANQMARGIHPPT